ncbi:MAG: glycoside hydrolase domain-containing protein [Phycisphaeraceae bacterium]
MLHHLPIRLLCLLLVSGAFAFTAGAAHAKPGDPDEQPDITYRYPLVTAPRVDDAPQIDGKVDKAEWLGAAQLAPMVSRRTGQRTAEPATVWIAYTQEAIHMAWRFDRPPYANAPRSQTEPDDVWGDDAMELLLRPEVGSEVDYNFVINAGGVGGEGRRTQGTDKSWNAEWSQAASVDENGWEGEATIPFTSLPVGEAPTPGTVWEFLAVRNRKTPEGEMGMSSYFTGWPGKPHFGYLRFGGDAPAVRVREAGTLTTETGGALMELVAPRGSTRANVEVTLYAPSAASEEEFIQEEMALADDEILLPEREKLNFFQLVEARGVKQTLALYDRKGHWQETVMVEADKPVRLPMTEALDPGEYVLYYRVTDASSDRLLGAAALPFVQEPAFELATQVFALSNPAVQVEANYPRLAQVPAEAQVVVTVLDADGNEIDSKQTAASAEQRRTELFVPVGDRRDQTLTVRGRIVGADGETLAEDERPVRMPAVAPWYDNGIGQTDQVLPPWTPIELAGEATARVLLREYELGASGLPARITSRDKSLLVEPATLTLAGEPLAWSRERLEQRDAKVVWRSRAAAGGARFVLTTTLEYDGLLRYELAMEPGDDAAELRALEMRIPYAARHVTFHENYQREAFDSPHFEIGDFDTGLYWFCESAQGWQIGKKPLLETTSAGDTINWTVRFIGEEGKTLREPTTITWGLQALPVKPVDLSYQYDTRRAYRGGPTPIDRPELTENSLTYPVDGNMPTEAGTLWFRASYRANSRLVQIGEGDEAIHLAYTALKADGYANLLSLSRGDDFKQTERRMISMKDVTREQAFHPFGLLWQRDGDELRLTAVTENSMGQVLSSTTTIPYADWQAALNGGELRFGGAETIAVDEVAISERAMEPRVLAAQFDREPAVRETLTLVDPLDELRFSRARYRTRPLHMAHGTGGVAGAELAGSFVRQVEGHRGRAVLLPAGERRDRMDLWKSYGGDMAFPWHEQWHRELDYYGANFHKNPAFREDVRKFLHRDIEMMFYANVSVLNGDNDPNVAPYIDELMRVPNRYGYGGRQVCPASPAPDYYIWGWKKNIDYYGIRGVHLDNTINSRHPCRNRGHDCGWIDEDGERRAAWPIFAAREYAKRWRWLFHEYVDDGFLSLHAGARLFPPVAGFMDITQGGEGWVGQNWEKLPLPEDFADNHQWRHGVPLELLTKRRKHRFGPNYLFMYAMLYDMSLRSFSIFMEPEWWHVNPDDPSIYRRGPYNPYFVESGTPELATPLVLWWALKDEFGTRHAAFHPFWANAGLVQLNHGRLRTSLWAHSGEGVLFMVANFDDEAVDAVMTVDLSQFDLADRKLAAYDAWTDQAYVVDQTTIRLTIPSREYRLVRLEPADPSTPRP